MFKQTPRLKNLWAQVKEKIMSLIYTDKNNTNRSEPSLNSDDVVADRLAHGTTQAQNSIDSVDVDRLSIQERQIIAINNGVNKAVYGFLADGSFGLKVAEDGVDVLTAGDNELIFNSSQNMFKVVSTGTVTVTLANGYASYTEYTQTVTHNLGNTPMILGSVDFPVASTEGRFMLPITLPYTVDGTTAVSAFLRVYDNSFACCVKAFNGGASTWKGDYTFRYYILQETAA